MKYTCFTTDSISLMAEAGAVVAPNTEVATFISEEITFRMRTIIAKAIKFMRHGNRNKLTCADINRALKWSDCQPVFGHQCNPNQRIRYSYSTEAKVFRYENNEIDLKDRFEQQPDVYDLLSEDMIDEAVPHLSFTEEPK